MLFGKFIRIEAVFKKTSVGNQRGRETNQNTKEGGEERMQELDERKSKMGTLHHF